MSLQSILNYWSPLPHSSYIVNCIRRFLVFNSLSVLCPVFISEVVYSCLLIKRPSISVPVMPCPVTRYARCVEVR